MIQIEESNPSFESCSDCIYSDDSEETCILRRCIHAVAQLNECYVPKQPTIEPRCETCESFNQTRLLIPQPQRKKGKWIYGESEAGNDGYYCSKCGNFVPWKYDEYDIDFIKEFLFCNKCGADMTEGEG